MKLIYLNLILSFLYTGCSGLSVKAPLPAKVSSAPPTAELFPVQKHYYNSPSKYGPHLKGKLAGRADDFVNAGKKYNVNPRLLMAIAKLESGNGSSKAAKYKSNISGSMVKTKRGYKLKSFSSVSASIFAMSKNLRENYLNRGRVSVSQISRKYCPYRSSSWTASVNTIMKKLP